MPFCTGLINYFMASMFQMQLVRYGNDHNIFAYSWQHSAYLQQNLGVELSIFSLLLGRIITGNNNNDLLHVNNILQPNTSFTSATQVPLWLLTGNGNSIWATCLDWVFSQLEGHWQRLLLFFTCSWSLIWPTGIDWLLKEGSWEREYLGWKETKRPAWTSLFRTKLQTIYDWGPNKEQPK